MQRYSHGNSVLFPKQHEIYAHIHNFYTSQIEIYIAIFVADDNENDVYTPNNSEKMLLLKGSGRKKG